MNMDRYLYVKSNQSDSYFMGNEIYKFKVRLQSPISFSGFWKVGLVEFHVFKQRGFGKRKSDFAIYIFTNICKDSIVNGVEKPLLRRLEINTRDGWSYQFQSPFYVPLRKQAELVVFEIIIKTEDDSFASFIDSPLHFTLHFKQYPFFTDFESL